MKALMLMVVLLVILTTATVFGATFNITNPTQLQTALTTAGSNGEDDTINVAAGTYNITTTLTYVPPGASEGSLTIQGAGVGVTVLDGGSSVQILNIDTSGLTDDSSAHITTRGMTFQNGDNSTGTGGGLFIFTSNADITVEYSEFSNNSALYQGGAYIGADSGVVTLTNSTFSGNTAVSNEGGGALVGSFVGPVTLTNNTFSGNSAEGAGGARVVSVGNTITLTNNTFNGNFATNGTAGGVNIIANSTVTLTSNTFNGNSATIGGAGGAFISSSINSAVTLTNNTFIGNSADGAGGGAGLWAGAVTLTNNVFNNNSSAFVGGGAFVITSSAVVTNNTFSGNSAVDSAGGLSVVLGLNSATANIYNNIIWGNTAATGGDLFVGDDGNNDGIGATVNLYSNDFSDFVIDDGDNLSQGGNINQDPLLTLDFHLQTGSPAIDDGYNSAPSLPSTDFEGEPRVMNGTVDIGADEYPGPVIQLAVPTMTEWGMIVFMLFAGLGAVYYLRIKMIES